MLSGVGGNAGDGEGAWVVGAGAGSGDGGGAGGAAGLSPGGAQLFGDKHVKPRDLSPFN